MIFAQERSLFLLAGRLRSWLFCAWEDASNNVQLKEETGILTAGQAYVFVPGENIAGQTTFTLYTEAEALADFVPTQTPPAAVNGLVPVFEQTVVPTGAGLFNTAHTSLLLSEGSKSDVVAPNTGYFLDLAATTETGDAFIPAEGTITGITNIIVDQKADNRIYTISGVRMNSLKNLPAGLYIINGKKYMVK